MIGLLRQKARAIVWRLTPCSRAKYNALICILADTEIKRRRNLDRRRRLLEHKLHEQDRIKQNRKDIMRIVMSAKKPPEPKETTRYIVVDQDGQLVQTLEMIRRAQ